MVKVFIVESENAIRFQKRLMLLNRELEVLVVPAIDIKNLPEGSLVLEHAIINQIKPPVALLESYKRTKVKPISKPTLKYKYGYKTIKKFHK